MDSNKTSISFSGERFVPGNSGRRIEADHIERYLFATAYVKDKKVLDIACGVGYGSTLLRQAGANKYVGVDICNESIRYANQVYSTENTSFIVNSICSYKPPESFDVIVCFETIEHVDCYKPAISNLYSILKPGGLLIISSPNRVVTSPKARYKEDKPSNIFHTQEFTPNELMELLVENGFQVKNEDVFGQRQRWLYNNKTIQALVRLTRFPDIFAFISSPKLKPVVKLTPRYFVIVARKKKTET